MFEWLTAVPPLAIALVVMFVVALESVGLPLPGETVLIAGLLAAIGGHHEWWMISVGALIGATVGDSVGYLIGARYGDRLFSIARARMPRVFSEQRLAAATGLIETHGAWAVFFGRFVAILRVFAGPLAGSLGMPYPRFLVANAAGAVAWVSAVSALTVLLGAAAEQLIHAISWAGLAIVILLVVVAVIAGLRGLGIGTPRAVRHAASAAWAGIRRLPVSSSVLGLYLVAGIATAALWSPLIQRDWYSLVAYGVPSFAEGRWWTVVTGTFVSAEPLHYALLIVVVLVGVGWCEYRRGSRFTALAFGAGQLGAVLGGAALIDVFALTGSRWANELMTAVDVGPSGGVVACFAFAIATLPSPWRLRGRLALAAGLIVPLLYSGTLADVEHAVAGGVVLAFGFSRSPQRATVREWRLMAFFAVILIGIVQVIAIALPTSGPFGATAPGEVLWWDLGIDVVVILAIAGGLLRGRRVAWWIAVVLAALNVAQGLLVLSVLDHLLDDIAGVEVALANSVLWLCAGALLVVARRAFRVPLRGRNRFLSVAGEAERARAVEMIHNDGGGTLAWMTTWKNIRYVFGQQTPTLIGVRRAGAVAIALGDPIGPVDDRAAALADWRERSEELDLVPCVFSASTALREAVGDDWRALQVAEDTIVDLPGLEFTGKSWQPVRGASNRAEREGIIFRLTHLSAEPWAIVAQVRAISEQWVGDKALPEMEFTLGGVDESLDPEVRTALALDADGSVHGVLSWLPVYGTRTADGPVIDGWVLDVMRRRDGAFSPVIEFLIGQSLLAFRDEGAAFASLSGAPLATSEDADAPEPEAIDVVLERLGAMLEPAYGFRSLHAFKRKFHPRTEPTYLLYRDEADLPAIGIGLIKAYLPQASTLDLARMGLSLGRK